ncbi:MAG: ribosome small subunit-dependent GTPase A, partial [Bacillota bacterium]|nr:ribosome small subunit-dependent GTPase A [Bacillota bacterium]
GLEELRRLICGKRVALAGSSGVGKSTILNRLIPEAVAETGVISEKSQRGKHTTRHSELFVLEEPTAGKKKGTFIFDTPGFTSFDILEAEEEELEHLYPEFRQYLGTCRYHNCRHIAEPGCGVRKALEEGKISPSRYTSYKEQLEEIKKSKQY